jgi:hypothetical protein
MKLPAFGIRRFMKERNVPGFVHAVLRTGSTQPPVAQTASIWESRWAFSPNLYGNQQIGMN